MSYLRYFLISWLLVGAPQIHAGDIPVEPIKNFNLQDYLGTWYEIARIDNSFEEGMSNVTASYSIDEDGTLVVINKGFEDDQGQWDETQGYAEFADQETTGHLEITFFWPFYADYVVFEVDESAYQYAFITSDSNDYLWLLAKTPSVDQAVIDKFLAAAKQHKFNTKDLIFVSQDKYLNAEETANLVAKDISSKASQTQTLATTASYSF